MFSSVVCKFAKIVCNANLGYLHKSPLRNISFTRISLRSPRVEGNSHEKGIYKMDSGSRHLVFVYGTLKKGEPNYHVIQDPPNGVAEYIGKAKTTKAWPLVIASRYNIPFLLFKENHGKQVLGEVYSVDSTKLAQLDELECHPKYYERVLEEVRFTEVAIDSVYKVSDKCQLWIYFLKNFRTELLNLPYLDDYLSKGHHGLEYVASEETSDPEDIY